MLLSSFFRTALPYSLSAFSQCEKIAGFPFFSNWMAHTQFLHSNITRENYNFAIEDFASKIEYIARYSVISVPHQLTIFLNVSLQWYFEFFEKYEKIRNL